MAHVYADRVRETTSTTGTGSLTLAGAASGFQSFSAGVGTGNDTHYCVTDPATGAWEVTAGNLSGSTTLTRGTLLASSTGSRIDFGSGAKEVFCVLPGAEIMRRTEVQAALDHQAECIIVPLSDETTAITTGNAKVTIHLPFAFTLTNFVIGLTTVSSSGPVTVDMNEAGSTVLSTKPSIDASEYLSTTGTAAVISDASLAQWAKIEFDIDAAGTGAKGLKAYLIGTRS